MATPEAEPHPCLGITGLPIGWDPAGEDGPGWYLLYSDVEGPRALRLHRPHPGTSGESVVVDIGRVIIVPRGTGTRAP